MDVISYIFVFMLIISYRVEASRAAVSSVNLNAESGDWDFSYRLKGASYPWEKLKVTGYKAIPLALDGSPEMRTVKIASTKHFSAEMKVEIGRRLWRPIRHPPPPPESNKQVHQMTPPYLPKPRPPPPVPSEGI